MSDRLFLLLQHEQLHVSCMRICSSIGNASTVHVYDDDKGARAQPYDIWFPLLEHGQLHLSCIRICYEPLFNLSVTLYCTIIMYWAEYWQFLLSCMSWCSSIGNVSTVHVYIYMTMKKARAHSHTTHGSHYSNMGSFIFRACTYVWKCKHRSRMYMTMKACLDRVHGEHGVQLSLGVTL